MADQKAAKLAALKALISEMVDDIASEGMPAEPEPVAEVAAAPVAEESDELDPAKSEELKARFAALMAE